MNTKLIPEPGFVNVYSTNQLHLATLKKLELEANGIPAIIFDQRDSSYSAFGFIYLSVPRNLELKALEIIKDNE